MWRPPCYLPLLPSIIYLLPIAHCLLPIAHCLLLTAYYLPLTAYCPQIIYVMDFDGADADEQTDGRTEGLPSYAENYNNSSSQGGADGPIALTLGDVAIDGPLFTESEPDSPFNSPFGFGDFSPGGYSHYYSTVSSSSTGAPPSGYSHCYSTLSSSSTGAPPA